jgi:hypothetical protein
MDRVSATLTATFISGYEQEWTSQTTGKSGVSARAFFLRDGSNSPTRVDLKPETLALLDKGERYALDVLIKARVMVTETGALPQIDVWVRSAVLTPMLAHAAA